MVDCVLHHFHQYFSCIMAVSVIAVGKSTEMSQVNDHNVESSTPRDERGSNSYLRW